MTLKLKQFECVYSNLSFQFIGNFDHILRFATENICPFLYICCPIMHCLNDVSFNTFSYLLLEQNLLFIFKKMCLE